MSPSWKVRSIQCWQSHLLLFLSRPEYQPYFQRFFFLNKYYLSEIYLVYSTDNKAKYSSSYNNIKKKGGHLISLRHFRFGLLVVKNPWRTLAFYFQSSLNCALNYFPVLTTPRVFVEEFFSKILPRIPNPFCTLLSCHNYSDTRRLWAYCYCHHNADRWFEERKLSFLWKNAEIKIRYSWLDKGEKPIGGRCLPVY